MSIPDGGGNVGGGGYPPAPPGHEHAGPAGYPGPPPAPGGGGNTWVGVLIGCSIAGVFGFIIIGILAAIAIPDFLKFSARAKQSEAKSNLGAIFTTQVAYFGEYGTYGHTFEQLGWGPEGDTSYSYYLVDDVIPATKYGAGPHVVPEDLKPYTTDQTFLVIAVGNIDNDSILDVWTMDDAKTLRNVVNDTSSYGSR